MFQIVKIFRHQLFKFVAYLSKTLKFLHNFIKTWMTTSIKAENQMITQTDAALIWTDLHFKACSKKHYIYVIA